MANPTTTRPAPTCTSTPILKNFSQIAWHYARSI